MWRLGRISIVTLLSLVACAPEPPAGTYTLYGEKLVLEASGEFFYKWRFVAISPHVEEQWGHWSIDGDRIEFSTVGGRSVFGDCFGGEHVHMHAKDESLGPARYVEHDGVHYLVPEARWKYCLLPDDAWLVRR